MMLPPLGELRFWPKQTWADLSLFPYLMVALLILIGLLNIYWYYRKRNTILWNAFLKHALEKHLDQGEIHIIRNFYENLPGEQRERILFDRRLFYSTLYDHLAASGMVEQLEKVRLMEKLFSTIKHEERLFKLTDLHPGETCSMELEGQHHLCYVVGVRTDRIYISFRNFRPGKDYRSHDTNLYAYQPDIGSYRIPVTIADQVKNGLSLLQNGELVFKSEEHLVAILEFPLQLSPWFTHPAGEKEGEEKKGEGPGNFEENAAEPVPDQWKSSHDRELEEQERILFQEGPTLTGTSLKISDRALLLEMDEESRTLYDRRQQIWEILLTLPDGKTFRFRGNLFPSPGSRTRFLFKFLDTSEEERHELFRIIKNAGPRRERLI